MKKMKRNENNKNLFDYCKKRNIEMYDISYIALIDVNLQFQHFYDEVCKKPHHLRDVYVNYSLNKVKAFTLCCQSYDYLIRKFNFSYYTSFFIESFNIFQFTLSFYFVYNNVIYKMHFTKAKTQIIQLSESEDLLYENEWFYEINNWFI